MVSATFDGPNLRIILPAGEREIDVQRDLYSAWKVWALQGDNTKFPPAFRSTGGDPLTPGIDAGAYFFIQNQDGWRIRPAEEDGTVFFRGNLAPEDSALDIATPTLGDFTVLLLNIQPVTQNIDQILLTQQDALYNGEVWIDVSAGVAGTDFPIGTSTDPVNNVVDAFEIASRLSIRRFVIVNSAITLDRATVNWTFEGRGAQPTVNVNSQDVSGSEFFRCSPAGDMVNTTGDVRLSEALLVNVDNFRGIAESCGIAATISLKAGNSKFIRCYSTVAGQQTPVVNCNSAAVTLAFRAYDGGLELTNFDQVTNECSIDANSARIVLGPTVSEGDLVLRGVGEVDDTSGANATVDTEGFVDAQEVEIIHQMVAGNIDISQDNRTITVYKQGSTTDVLATFDVSVDGRMRRRLS